MLEDMDLNDLLDFARIFANLGDAITSQVLTLVECYYSNLDYKAAYELNQNAIRRAQDLLADKHEDLDEAFSFFWEACAINKPEVDFS